MTEETRLILGSRISEEVKGTTSIIHRGQVRFPGIAVRPAEVCFLSKSNSIICFIINKPY
jgi:hypothetical protein